MYIFTVVKDKFSHIVHGADNVVQENNQSDANTLHSRKTVDDSVLNTKSHVCQSNIMSLLISPLHHVKHIKPSNVESEFYYMTKHVIELLSYCHPTLLIERCRQLMASEIHRIKLFPTAYLNKLKSFKTSSAILKMLSIQWTWSNFSILTYLAVFSRLSVSLLEEFNLQIVLSYPIVNYPFPSLVVPFDDNNYTFLIFQYKDNIKGSFHVVIDMQSILTEKCEITQYTFQLLAVRSDPIELKWMIPLNVVDLINKKINQHIQYFASKGINAILIYPDAKYYISYNVKVGPIIVLSGEQVIVKIMYAFVVCTY